MHTPAEVVARRWFDEVWNHGNEATIDDLFSPDCFAYGLGENEGHVHGPEEFKVFYRNMRSAFPDVHIHVEDVVAEEGKAAVRVVLEGTHLGEGLGMPPTGNRVKVAGIVVISVAGGQIVSGWNSWDQLGLLRQVEAPAVHDGVDRFLTARG